mmetsp:Transcript_18343/g.24523  ORF Transcript_18343/g.24523 Transcript_18343/m.24523 type:complete len:135 (+) Transcript_18343:385-789(+)
MPSPDKLTGVEWKSLKEEFPDATLFGKNSIQPSDISQGALGNCWFLAAAAAIAEYPGRMEDVFAKGLKLKAPGAYAMNFYTLGVPHTVVVDDMIPFLDNKPMFSKLSNDGAIWPMILEKAFAKMRGNYRHIIGG